MKKRSTLRIFVLTTLMILSGSPSLWTEATIQPIVRLISPMTDSKNLSESIHLDHNAEKPNEEPKQVKESPIKRTLPDLPTLYGECSLAVPHPSVSDISGRTLQAKTDDPIFYSEQGTYTVTWSYEFGSDGPVEQKQQIVVKDVSALLPDLMELPTISGACSVTLTPPSAFDTCKGEVFAKTYDPLVYDKPGDYSVLWIFEDGNGNATFQEQLVEIQDLVPPTIIAPEDLIFTINQDESFAPSDNLEQPEGWDNCSEVFISQNAPAFFPIGETTVTWTISDENGNSSFANQQVTVLQGETGSISSFNDLVLGRELKPGEFYLYPNPASTETNLYVGLDQASMVKIKMFDTNGRLVYTNSTQQSGNFNYTLPLEDLSAGLYQIQIGIGTQTVSKKLIKK